MEAERNRLISTIRQIYGGVVWTHKTHEKDREIYSRNEWIAKWINVVLITSTTVSLVVSIFVEENIAIFLSTLLGAVSTAFAVYRLSFSPEKDAQLHREAAKALLSERDRLVFLIEKVNSSNADLDQIRKELERIRNKVGNIYHIAPDTSSKAYQKATQALNSDEELTFSIKEIDNLLPQELRIDSSEN